MTTYRCSCAEIVSVLARHPVPMPEQARALFAPGQ